MNRELLIEIVSRQIKLIRTEQDYTQDKMADVLGISKKTLLQIEKERMQAGWTVVVAVCALFKDSEILQSSVGNDPVETATLVTREQIRLSRNKTLGGRVWWRELRQSNGFRLQQNMISKHYRILDGKDYRLFSTTVEEEAINEFQMMLAQESNQ